MKILARIVFTLWGILSLSMAAATIIEHGCGTAVAMHYIYHSAWFIASWTVLGIGGLIICIIKALYRRQAAFLLHIALCIILAGAFTTFLTSERGYIHLRTDGQAPADSDIKLPFNLTLERFDVDYYAGTQTPESYVSHVVLEDREKTVRADISINKILRYGGYRFYQSSYDSDKKGTVLAINYDPIGTPMTYAGYLLLAISMIWLLFSRRGKFRTLLKGFGIIALLCTGLTGTAQTTIPREIADHIGKLPMLYNDRIVPLDTYATEFTHKLTEKSSYKNFTAVQVLMGWLFYADEWEQEPMIKVKDKNVRHIIGCEKYARYTDFFENDGSYKLLIRKRNEKIQQAINTTDEKIQLIRILQSGLSLKLFPIKGDWYAPTDYMGRLPKEDALFASGVFQLLAENIATGNTAETCHIIDKIAAYQHKQLPEVLPDNKLISCELFYNHYDLVTLLSRINLTAGLLACIYCILFLATRRRKKAVETIMAGLTAISLAGLTLSITLRWYISGHIPLGNGYETMTFIAWCIMTVSLISSRKLPFLCAPGLLLSGFALLVASIGFLNPQVTHLMPVLASPWLSIHVSLVMMAYTLLGFIFCNAAAALLTHSFTHRTDISLRLDHLNRILLYPAVFLLAAGIFTGAVWANVSWGRYWGWDPKETWALITMLIYALPFHDTLLRWLHKPLYFHLYCLLAFASVCMTYFGVNFLGGLHSYGG